MENRVQPAIDFSRWSRRGFLASALRSLALALSADGLCSLAAQAEHRLEGRAEEEWWGTVVAVQEHLLPSETDVPGARELGAAGYLRLLLLDTRFGPEARNLLSTGAATLNEASAFRYGKDFQGLDAEQRERALRAFEKTKPGRRWLGEMLDFLFEAALGDPAYGGNPNQLGWKWLGINPGFPLRPAPARRGRDPA